MTDLARVDHAAIVGEDTLKYLGLNPNTVEARALVLLCRRYALDPLLGEVSVIKTRNGNRVYITRDGMVKIAHESGQLDGIVVEEQRESDHGWSATVSVHRKDMNFPFTYKGGCGVSEPQANAGNGPEMALARAERRALRRAFAIPAYDDADDPQVDADTGEISPTAPGPEKGEPRTSRVIASPAPHLAAAAPGPPMATADPDGGRKYSESPFRGNPPLTRPSPVSAPAPTVPEPPSGRPSSVVSTPAGPPTAPPKPDNNTWKDGTPMFDEHGKPI